MQYDFDRIIDRTGTRCIKSDFPHRSDPDLPEDALLLWVADMDFGCPPPILNALHARLDREILGYTHMDDEEYRNTVTGWFSRRHGWDFPAEQIVFSSGVVSAFYQAMRFLTVPGSKVLLMTPAYHPFADSARAAGRELLFSRLLEQPDGTYRVDWEDFEQKASDPACTLFFLCSPQNPTGRVWTPGELRKMGEICFANGVFVVSDEIHCDLTRTGIRHTPFASLFPDETRLVTCTAPSKTFNIAGTRHANLFIPDPALRDRWKNDGLNGHTGAFGPTAVIAAYTECDEWLEQLRGYLDDNFALLHGMLESKLPGVLCPVPEGTYLAWPDFSALGLSDAELRERISRAGVYIQYGQEFVDHGDGHARINLAAPRSVIRKAAERICSALKPVL